MSSVFTKTRSRRRLSEASAWILGLAASAALATGVYTLAAAPFTTTIDDESALPKELATTSGQVSIPLPAELSPNARGDNESETEPTTPVAPEPVNAEAPTTTGVPVQLVPGSTAPTSAAPAPAQAPAPAPAPAAQNNSPAPTAPATQPTPTQTPQTTPPTTAAQNNDGALAPIIDPVTGLVRGTVLQEQDQ